LKQMRDDLNPLAVLQLLDRAAEKTDDPALRRAARAARQQSAGRPPINDKAALAEIAWLISSGTARSWNDAARMVVKTLAGRATQRSAVERLRRKKS
jgi:hypothetical protein